MKDARYQYYKHGPLARMVLGDQQVQGLDYAYTVQGWLKGVNSTGLQANYNMGRDGDTSWLNRYVARDAVGFNLNYFTGDYKAVSSAAIPFAGTSAYLGSSYKPLYNGNISSMAVNTGQFNNPVLYAYSYDQLNRLTAMDAFNGLNRGTNSWSGLTALNDYKERIAYDANGNILKYLRNGVSSINLTMDSLTYQYNRDGTGRLLNNQLNYVRDEIGGSAGHGSNYPTDIDDQLANNYGYDATGNLTRDDAEGITNISWNVYGKIREIQRAAGGSNPTINIRYSYDAGGSRISKQVTDNAGNSTYTWYAKDATGNVMSVYNSTGSGATLTNYSVQQTEAHLYGSSRLGIVSSNIDTRAAFTVAGIISNQRGCKSYELSNHLGNVLTAVSDKKLAVSSGGSTIDYYRADVVAASDYYPFGMQAPGRTFTAGGRYRYSFNGKENDREVKGDGDQIDYGMRVYDPRLGRFLSVDPITKKYPELTPYQFASNTPVQAIDLDGKEAFFIHGTASGPQMWTPKLTNFIKINLTNNIHADATFSWQSRNGYTNSDFDRRNAAVDLVTHVIEYRQKNRITDEEITLIGHSHGGNIAIQAAKLLNQEYGIIVNIVNFNTPAFNGLKDSENPQLGYGINKLVHYWTKQDGVAGGIVGSDKYAIGVRTDVKNIELIRPLKSGNLEAHFMENLNLDELNAKKFKPEPVPPGQANPTVDKYNPNWKPASSGSDIEKKQKSPTSSQTKQGNN